FTKACGAQTDVFNQKFAQKLSSLLNLASVKYVLSLTDIEDAGGDTEHRFKLAYQSDNHIRVYENRNAAPRAYLVHNAKFVQDPDKALAEIQSSSFDPSKTVIIEEGARSNATKTSNSIENIEANSSKKKQAAVSTSQNQPGTEYEAVKSFDLPNSNSISIETDSPNENWLVLTDIYYPGWNAYVDGAKAEIKRANFAFRAVKIESGKHTIKFAYEPSSFLIACFVFLSFAISAAWMLISGNWKRQF
ncbi:MAG: YfhO family protein, partial [Candidatus Obscuribacterales bacterium]|nr:YfhO family protein [Candidatus Obscuribacterales bacterium]